MNQFAIAGGKVQGAKSRVDDQRHRVALSFLYSNFRRVHSTLRVTPALEAAVTGHVCSIDENVCPFARDCRPG